MRYLRPQTGRRVALVLGTAVALVSGGLFAQTTPYFNRNIIVLDPAHGGDDTGARLSGQAVEKDITLQLAASLRTQLTARGFTVVSTRDAEVTATPLLTGDQRAGMANHLRPAACIILHATATGTGVSLSTSSLPASITPYDASAPVPWDSAQSLYVTQSQRLANDLGLALQRARLPVVLMRTALKPLDNLTCAAVAVEVAPLAASDAKTTPVTDIAYQQRIADSLATAILGWREATAPKAATRPAAATSGGNP